MVDSESEVFNVDHDCLELLSKLRLAAAGSACSAVHRTLLVRP
jgi:hypothetical protein